MGYQWVGRRRRRKVGNPPPLHLCSDSVEYPPPQHLYADSVSVHGKLHVVKERGWRGGGGWTRGQGLEMEEREEGGVACWEVEGKEGMVERR
jgi:hypothetical protein